MVSKTSNTYLLKKFNVCMDLVEGVGLLDYYTEPVF